MNFYFLKCGNEWLYEKSMDFKSFVACILYSLCLFSVNDDAVSGTMLFYGVMIVGFAILCLEALKINNVAVLYIGNILSFISSYEVAELYGLELKGQYFKPLTTYSLTVALSIVAIVCQTIPVLYTCRKKKMNKQRYW